MSILKQVREIFMCCSWLIIPIAALSQSGIYPPEYEQINYKAGPRPDRILLTWDDDPQTTQTVTWRTDTTITKPRAELAVGEPSSDFADKAEKFKPVTTKNFADGDTTLYHSVRFTNLLPNTVYVYRVGDGRYWSEWIQFRTAEIEDGKFSFIYMGDAQNKLFFHWSRMIRAAYAQKPDARFILHAGDLINNAGNTYEWGEWFEAGSFIHRSIPVVAIPGNHEYYKDESGHKTGVTKYWKPQFNFPDNGVKGLEETSYFLDYKNVRLICLNSNEKIDEQAIWLDSVLQNNPKRWVVVTFHHPVLAVSKQRINEGVYIKWKPLLDKYRVDLVLNGHDHAYARGTNLNVGKNADDPESGTVYVVSNSGPKMYELTVQDWMESAANNTSLYQVIDVEPEQLTYRAYTYDGQVYDAITIRKQERGINKIEKLPTEVNPRLN